MKKLKKKMVFNKETLHLLDGEARVVIGGLTVTCLHSCKICTSDCSGKCTIC